MKLTSDSKSKRTIIDQNSSPDIARGKAIQGRSQLTINQFGRLPLPKSSLQNIQQKS